MVVHGRAQWCTAGCSSPGRGVEEKVIEGILLWTELKEYGHLRYGKIRAVGSGQVAGADGELKRVVLLLPSCLRLPLVNVFRRLAHRLKWSFLLLACETSILRGSPNCPPPF